MTAITTTSATEKIMEPDGRASELVDLPHDEESLLRLFKLLFEEHAKEITFGPCIQGAVFEIHAEKPGVCTMLVGYLTVGFESRHFPRCIGEHRGTQASPCAPQLAEHRRVKRAALFRTRGRSCVPASWG